MNLIFDTNLALDYHSNTQKIRIMSENWVVDNVYCVRCGSKLNHFENNKPVGDMFCENCKEEFELKSNKAKLGKKIVDGAYSTMIEKIENDDIPNFFYLNYSIMDYKVKNLLIIPKHYFTKEIIVKRPPLSETAHRAGWIGCNIDVSSIPKSGMLYIIKNGQEENKNMVIKNYNKMLFLRKSKGELRGWLLDILKCIESLDKKEFTLNEIYSFEKFLKLKHPNNNNIQAKIRQQLQILRDYGYLSFTNRGEYRLL
ncbi:MAG: DpnI domain-containing protein [Sphaerochaetaceae bacterium]|nr:DpnI domain-containing protein [Sphaerochaetaceae bacterium]